VVGGILVKSFAEDVDDVRDFLDARMSRRDPA
jgi:hypothetical protein